MKKLKILILEDNEKYVDMYKKSFSDDCEFYVTGLSGEAERWYAFNKPDIAVINITVNDPEMNPYLMIKAVAPKERLTGTYCVLCYDKTNENCMYAAMKLGFSSCFQVPEQRHLIENSLTHAEEVVRERPV